MNHKIVC